MALNITDFAKSNYTKCAFFDQSGSENSHFTIKRGSFPIKMTNQHLGIIKNLRSEVAYFKHKVSCLESLEKNKIDVTADL